MIRVSKKKLTEVEQLQNENRKLRNAVESHKVSRDIAWKQVEQLEQRVNDKARIAALEQLCGDLFDRLDAASDWTFDPGDEELEKRVYALGLIKGSK